MTPHARTFAEVWESCTSLAEVAHEFNMTPESASVRASILRKQGMELKHMTKVPSKDNKRLMTRTTEEEYEAWAEAAEKAGQKLGLPNLTIGPWSRMVLNQAARALGIKLPED